ncbi:MULTISPECIES: hypothetical protein [unclassified Enterococcus]|uniref:hypothetical protein n=1 Tax=unclassified Enterococcus TaxID=2608891 RepID=UPI00155419D2|nr:MULTISPECIES: hypothetical protein [unclassified Enterococcus]MBS7576657.1 hypothetical protein [Enterococcus sp. MMGLQ5-2]MBS7583856.1 hypothetical protein [Enterococcus sp. MMGLQ5-1]NPD11717.1 hypothetical protein [Enterococcus sp. MMGLQ5-1]NPD36494.1 hypothetical protein [Enterococcus sp. MMGLQ5-2]
MEVVIIFIPFDLILPEKFARQDIEITLIPLMITEPNLYSSDGDILVVANLENVLAITNYLEINYFYIIKQGKRLRTTKLISITDSYHFISTDQLSEKIDICYDELGMILGQIIMSYHDFADLSNEQGNKYIRQLN